mgnify:CR=1 FL=1
MVLAAVCSEFHVHNPTSNTCMRLVRVTMTWAEADTECRGLGERLATLTEASIAWWNSAPTTASMAHLHFVYTGYTNFSVDESLLLEFDIYYCPCVSFRIKLNVEPGLIVNTKAINRGLKMLTLYL